MKPGALLDAGPDAVPTGWRYCGNCQTLVSQERWHQCPAIFERRAA